MIPLYKYDLIFYVLTRIGHQIYSNKNLSFGTEGAKRTGADLDQTALFSLQ